MVFQRLVLVDKWAVGSYGYLEMLGTWVRQLNCRNFDKYYQTCSLQLRAWVTCLTHFARCVDKHSSKSLCEILQLTYKASNDHGWIACWYQAASLENQLLFNDSPESAVGKSWNIATSKRMTWGERGLTDSISWWFATSCSQEPL